LEEEESGGGVECGESLKNGEFYLGGKKYGTNGMVYVLRHGFRAQEMKKGFLCFGFCVFLFMTAV
jgi:hypothetical protein